ncbi:MAG: hypothetical protein QM770_07125 [Tepidisphaeraceae bacterium]
MPKRVFITVAERSADAHAAMLVRELRKLDPTIQVDALAGDHLRDAGATVHHDTVSRAAMGLKAFKRAFEVKALLKWTDAFYARNKPDLHICCDSWTMNKHFAKLAKRHGVRVLYYIAPQAWASREGRVKLLAKVADRLACILPFEEKFFRDRGVNATFVGHPLFDEVTHPPVPPRESGVGPIVALPCGSRKGVAKANFPRQLEVAERIRSEFPNARFHVPTTPQTHEVVTSLVRARSNFVVRQDAFDELIAPCGLAITVSGTATLHIAAHGVPMIVVYHGSPILWHLVGRWMIRIRTFAQVNLLANDGRDEPSRHIVPEFIPWYGSIDGVANCAIEMLKNPSQLEDQRMKLRSLINRIGQPGASRNAAHIAFELL